MINGLGLGIMINGLGNMINGLVRDCVLSVIDPLYFYLTEKHLHKCKKNTCECL